MTEYMVKSRFHGDGKIVAAYLNDAGKVIVDILFLNSKALQQRVHPIATFPLFQAVSEGNVISSNPKISDEMLCHELTRIAELGTMPRYSEKFPLARHSIVYSSSYSDKESHYQSHCIDEEGFDKAGYNNKELDRDGYEKGEYNSEGCTSLDYAANDWESPQEEYCIKLRVKVDDKILNEFSQYFPHEDNAKYPRPIRALFGGKRRFLVYFSNASNSSFQGSINLLLATDIDNADNNRIFEDLNNETLSIYGFNTDKHFKITKILRVPRLVGTANNRMIKANVAFFFNHDISAYGLPEDLYQDIMYLPNAQSETKIITDRIAHWDEYLKINEKIAKETQVLLHYSGYRQSDHIMELIFFISYGAIFAKQKNATVQLVLDEDEIEENQISYKGPLIGTIDRFNKETKELVVNLDFDYDELLVSGKSRIPQSGRLFLTKLGDLVQIMRLRNGLKTFARGQAENQFLDTFMFDATQARGLSAPAAKLQQDQLLQANLNNEQIAAVEGAINCSDLFLVQGPPGTGKTTVIAEICYQNAIRNKKTLIASQTNLAVDNALSKLVHHPKIRALRKGNEQSVQEEGLLFTENNVIKTWLNKTANECNKRVLEKETSVRAAETAEKELIRIAEQYRIYLEAKENRESRTAEKAVLQAEKDALAEKLTCLEDKYTNVKKEVSDITLGEILSGPPFGDLIINAASTARTAMRNREKKRHTIVSNNKAYAKEIDVLQVSIRLIETVFNNANQKKKYIVTEEELLCGKILPFSTWQTEARAIELEVNLLLQKKPFNVFIYMGFAKKWIFSAFTLLNRYNEFKRSTNLMIAHGNEEFEELSESKDVGIAIKNLELTIITTINTWEGKIQVLEEELFGLESEIKEQREKQRCALEIIKEFNQQLPYAVKVDSDIDVLEQIAATDGVELFYLSLWRKQKETDLVQIKFIKSWVCRLEERSEEDYATFKQLYIDNANVIGITCNQSGSKEFTTQYPAFDVAIIDEVSKATPPELILAVLKAKKVVLVGDHKQLPPMVGMETYEEVAKQLDISEDETAHMKVSLFEELFIKASVKLKVMLSKQYRMHNQIMDTINQFYADENDTGLSCGIKEPDTTRAHHCHGKAIGQENHILWVDMPLIKENYEEQTYSNYSYSNQNEVNCIKDILLTISENLRENQYDGQKKVGIISFYSSQVRLLEQELLNRDFVDRIDNLSLRIGSVDRFQGIEYPVIISSFARNNPRGEIGFAKDPRRVNVALSRAQELSIIVGCSELFCSINKNVSATKIYQTIAKTILEAGGIRNALDFR